MAGDVEIREIDGEGGKLVFEIHHDGRFKRSIRWSLIGEEVEVRVPRGLRGWRLDEEIEKIAVKIRRQRMRSKAKADRELEARAQALNQRYFGGELQWHTICWVDNMRKRLGSCSHGGTTDGDIRISDGVRGWPDWVVDYVIAHEMVHRKHPNHSPEFWECLARYPKMERARGFIEGVAFQADEDAEGWL